MVAPFEASKLKLERAETHLEELKKAIEAYFDKKPCVIVVEQFTGMPSHVRSQAWTARVRNPVPLKLASIIGDVVHNLRASLDLLACDLVRLHGGPTKDVYFPFCEKSADLKHVIKRRRLDRAGRDIVAEIENLQPYRGGNAALRAIHDMDILDKHRALLPIIGAVSVPLGSIVGVPKTFAVREWHSLIEDGHKVLMLPERLSPFPLGAEVPARWFLAFDAAANLGSIPVIDCLERFSAAAKHAFDLLTSLRAGAVFPIDDSS